MFRVFKNIFLNILSPPLCLSCNKEGTYMCLPCSKTIKVIKNKSISIYTNKGLDALIFASYYKKNHTIQSLIKTFKFKMNQELVHILGSILVKQLKLHSITNPLLVPVPLHPFRKLYRGFNQSEKISEYISKKLLIPYKNILRRKKYTQTQSCLPHESRGNNVHNAFSCSKKLSRIHTYILIDDVATTLHTLNECAKTLKNAHAKEVIGCVIAKG